MSLQISQTKGVSPLDKRIAVAIDFGTTFSGLAWAKVLDGYTHLVDLWPGPGARFTSKGDEKVPTEIRYDQGRHGMFDWGFQIPTDTDRHLWFKLDLESNYDTTTALFKSYPHPKRLPSGNQQEVQKLIVDYLGALKQHVVNLLQLQLGERLVRDVSFHFILTVPAVWSDAAKDKTLKAAEVAGLGENAPILMISEPEAAATYALHHNKLGNLSVGDTFVVCDAGGGTVDLISYTIDQLHPVLQVKEAAPGSGGLCGSTYLNRRFQEFLESKLGSEEGFGKETVSEAVKMFDEGIKKQYSMDVEDDKYWVPVPGLADNKELGIKYGKFTIWPDDVREIFNPVINEVLELVEGQIEKTSGKIRAVLLVGGFGGSRYLLQRLQESVSKDIALLQPGYGLSAVVQGALLRGLADLNPKHAKVRLTSRMARKHIGTPSGTAFDGTKHLVSKRYFSNYSGMWMASVMAWFITKNDEIQEDTPFTFSYEQEQLVSKGMPVEYTAIIYCDRTDRPPVVHKDQHVVELVRLRVKVADLPPGAIKTRFGKDSKPCYTFDYEIEVTYLSGSTKYELVHNGQKYDAVTAEYA